MASELERFVGYEGDFRNAVEVSKLPVSEDPNARIRYSAELEKAAKNAPEGIKKRAINFELNTPISKLNFFASVLNRFYNQVSGGYFAEQKDAIVRQVEDERLEGLVLAIKHPEEGSEERKGIVGKIGKYQALAGLNTGYDNRKVKGEEVLETARGVVVEEVKNDIDAMKKEETAKYIDKATWGYIEGTLALIDDPDTPDEARKITGKLQKDKEDEVYMVLDTEAKRAEFVRESLGYLPVEAVRPLVYEVATAEEEKEE